MGSNFRRSKTGTGFQKAGAADREKFVLFGAAGVFFALLVLVVFIIQFKGNASAGQVSVAKVNEENLNPNAVGTVMLLTPETSLRPGSRLEDIRLKEILWPRNQVPEDAVRDVAEVRAMYAKVNIASGVPLKRSQLTDDELNVSLPLNPGNRAVVIQVDEVTSVDNHARPDTRVDVVLTYNVERELTSKVIVQNARVLSLGGDTSTSFRPGQVVRAPSRTITLDVPPKDALEIQTAKKLGTLSLMMRSADDYQPLKDLEIDRKQIDGGKRKPEKEICKKGTVMVAGQKYIMNCDGSLTEVE